WPAASAADTWTEYEPLAAKVWLTVVPLAPVTVWAAEPSPQVTLNVYEPVALPPVRAYVAAWPGTTSVAPETIAGVAVPVLVPPGPPVETAAGLYRPAAQGPRLPAASAARTMTR